MWPFSKKTEDRNYTVRALSAYALAAAEGTGKPDSQADRQCDHGCDHYGPGLSVRLTLKPDATGLNPAIFVSSGIGPDFLGRVLLAD